MAAAGTVNIAVLMTCHNRCRETLDCLAALHAQRAPGAPSLTVFLTDDGSIDGTPAAVSREFPGTRIIPGDGSLYWCKGMRRAWESARAAGGFDYYLWLNNDTYLHPGALASLLETARKRPGIVVGSCHEPEGGGWSYGGWVTSRGGKSLQSKPLPPTDEPQDCQLMNGNLVLVPEEVVRSIGILSPRFTHALGDFDYGLRALDRGLALTLAPGYHGVCARNPLPAWCDPDTPLPRRLALFNAPKGIHFTEYMVFCFRHFGLLAVWIGLKAVLRVLVPSLWLCGDGEGVHHRGRRGEVK